MQSRSLSLCVLLSGAALLLASCAASPPSGELLRARAAFERARTGHAGELARVDLREAQLALQSAESAYLDDDDGARDLAYVAERRAQIAQTRGRMMLAHNNTRHARAQIDSMEDVQRRTAIASLAVARAQVGTERAARTQTQAELERERTARADAERRAAAALESLRQLGLVRQEADRLIVTLSGSVLFATGSSVLLPAAQQRLDGVAASLLEHGFSSLTVGGHTDSRGSSSANEALSLARAQAVRTYLVSRGLPVAIQAVGFGESQPVTSNDSAEGRANNRRVELVIQPDAAR